MIKIDLKEVYCLSICGGLLILLWLTRDYRVVVLMFKIALLEVKCFPWPNNDREGSHSHVVDLKIHNAEV
jgi:hypothetical protein